MGESSTESWMAINKSILNGTIFMLQYKEKSHHSLAKFIFCMNLVAWPSPQICVTFIDHHKETMIGIWQY
jgi:hypothetical protein